MRKRLYVTTLGFMTLLAANARAAETLYDIRFERPFAAGQVFRVNTTGIARASQKIESPDGQVNTTASFRRNTLDADVRIERVTSDKKFAALSIKVNRLTTQSTAAGREANAAVEIVPGGTVIDATFEGEEATFSSKAIRALPADAVEVLKREFQQEQLRDAVFGAAEKKKVGDTWPLNTKAMKVDLTDPRGQDPREFTGTVKLAKAGKVLGVDCLQFEAVMKTDRILGLTVVPAEAAITVTYTAAVPTDPAKPVVAHTMRTVTHVVIEQKALGNGVLRTTSDSEVVHEATWTAK